MCRAADISALRHDCVGSEAHWRGVIDFGAIAYRHLVGAYQIPWSPDLRAGIEVAIAPHPGSERPEQQRAPGMERARGCSIQEQPTDVPKLPRQSVPERESRAEVWILCRIRRNVIRSVVVNLPGHLVIILSRPRFTSIRPQRIHGVLLVKVRRASIWLRLEFTLSRPEVAGYTLAAIGNLK